MSFPHEAIAAWPTPGTGDPDRALIRAMTTRRFAYCLAADEAADDFVAKDPVSGVPPLYLIQNSILFAYDDADSITVGDGVTCLVTNDACRYKSDTIAPPWSVLDKDLVAQPVSPSDGDRYLIPAAATGTDWAGKDGKIGIYKGLRWHFAVVPIGRFLYVEDETAFYHRNTSGVWTAGVGSIAISANSIPITAIIGAKASFVIKVENQTTNAPPASPVVPTAYIIGPSPTGAWAGKAGQLAICLTAGSFTVITPAEGDTVYDKALKNSYRFNGTAWESSAGAWARFATTGLIVTPTAANGVGSAYAFGTTAPTTSQSYSSDSTTQLTFAARRAGVKLRLRYTGTIAQGYTAAQVPAFFVDSLTSAIHWSNYILQNGNSLIAFEYVFDAPDALSHTYKFRVMIVSGGSNITFHRCQMTIEEAA